jgi:uncharacterized membrane protein (UPF0127 family)
MTATLRLFLCVLCLACAPASGGEEATPRQLRDFPETSLTITHAGGRDSFRVWVADSRERQQQGLMFVRSLPRDRGMLFPQREPRVMSMWMKNTFVPLDMLFIGPGGVIIGITSDTVPQSEEIITSPGPITAVLELNAGEAKRRGIRAGDKVETRSGL